MIKKLFSVLLFLCLFQCVALSAPNYDPNNVTTEWDPTYNINLRKKLENEFYKRHYIDEHHTSANVDSYYKEVLEPYELNKKKWSEVPKKYYKIETK